MSRIENSSKRFLAAHFGELGRNIVFASEFRSPKQHTFVRMQGGPVIEGSKAENPHIILVAKPLALPDKRQYYAFLESSKCFVCITVEGEQGTNSAENQMIGTIEEINQGKHAPGSLTNNEWTDPTFSCAITSDNIIDNPSIQLSFSNKMEFMRALVSAQDPKLPETFLSQDVLEAFAHLPNRHPSKLIPVSN